MSSEFFRVLKRPQNGARRLFNKGHTDFDRACSPSPTLVSEIAVFLLLSAHAGAIQQPCNPRFTAQLPTQRLCAADFHEGPPERSLCRPLV
ncbi:hypothetical protein D3C72_783860 [compost metagenome]